MTHERESPHDEPSGAEEADRPDRSRRQLLKMFALGAPAAAGALTALGRAAASAQKEESAFPGDPTVWRERFLAQGRAERGTSVAAVDVIDAPFRPSELPVGAGPELAPAPETQAEVRPKVPDL